MVDHVTTVTPDGALDPARLADMASALEAIGFTVHCGGRSVSFSSDRVEAQTAKAYLRAHGFRDRDFGIVLEYARQWGIL
jgi:hypothetical protein